MQVKIKKLHENAVIPTYAKNGDAGMDLTATSKSYDDHGNVVYGTGLAFEIPDGYVGFLFPRSSNTKKDLILGNSVGVLDSSYRGEVAFKFKPDFNFWDYDYSSDNLYFESASDQKRGWAVEADFYNIGERIGQIIIMPYPKIEFIEVNELEDSERGDGGFGSSGV